MITRNNVPVYDICWLSHVKGGIINLFYEPENKEELISLCQELYKSGKDFLIIGHTSNIYFLPSYNVDIIVSTRKVKEVIISDNTIIADCGVSVRALSRSMIDRGVEGFNGLVDLPGTVGASVYGNASCFNCSINNLLISFDLLLPSGDMRVH